MHDKDRKGDSAADKEAICVDAEEVFVLMKKNTRVSRNVRACWFFRHLKKTIPFIPLQELSLEALSQDLTLASLIPADGEPLLDAHQTYSVGISPHTIVTFLASRYRIVFTLDLSPSVVAVDVPRGKLISEEIFHNFCKCLRALVKPFHLPGSQLVFLPELFITVIAHTPVICCVANQVLIQGISVTQSNVDAILQYTCERLHSLEHRLSGNFTKLLDRLNGKKSESAFFSENGEPATDRRGSLMLKLSEEIEHSHELAFVDMLRCGVLALHMLPENSSSGLVVITDGMVDVPVANVLEGLLTQLRNNTITCSFLKVGSTLGIKQQLGQVPNFQLMEFIATATFGGYFLSCPDVSEDESYAPNVYHKAMYYWSFQKGLEGFSYDGSQDDPDTIGSPSWVHRRLYSHPVHGGSFGLDVQRMRRQEITVQAGLSDVLSVRLREGYTIREVHFLKGGSEIEVKLVLPWRDNGKVEYIATAAWPMEKDKGPTKIEIYVEGTYDFLHEIMCNSSRSKITSPYRSAHIKKFFQLLHNIGQTDKLLTHLQSFGRNPVNYQVPEYIRSGIPLFVLDTSSFVVNSQLSSKESQLSQFASFWKPVIMLDTNIWQKWVHSHCIGLVLEQDLPLPRYLHVPNSSGRFNILQCRQALASLTQLLRHWATFVLAENHSYIKFLGRGADKPPSYFCLLRLTSKSPYVILHLAFLGGTPSSTRHQEISALKLELAQLKYPKRYTQKSDRKPVLKVAEENVQDIKRIAPLLREWSEINCCTVLKKPLEKILIRYEQKPEDLTVVADRPYANLGDEGEGVSIQEMIKHPITSKFNTLSHYLVHHRWVWSVQADSSVPLTSNSVGKVLLALSKIRLQEGFHFASANSGICNMVLEVDMKDTQFSALTEGEEGDGEEDPRTCVVQYIVFPPHSKTSRDSVSEEDMDEMDGTEAEGEIQIVTECWVEPQFGICINNTPERLHFQHLNCVELSKAFFEVDFECIYTLTTFNHLQYLCQQAAKTPTLGTDVTQSGTSSPPSTPGRRHAVGKEEDEEKKNQESTVTFTSFHLNLVSLLPRSQQAELLFSTFVVGTGKASEEDSGVDPKGPNELLFSLLFERLKAIHDKEYILSPEETAKYMEQLCKRPRDLGEHPLPFLYKIPTGATGHKDGGADFSQARDKGSTAVSGNKQKGQASGTAHVTAGSTGSPGNPQPTNMTGSSYTSTRLSDLTGSGSAHGSGNGRYPQKEMLQGLPMWKCYMKAVSVAHMLLTFIPSSYDDLLLLNEEDRDRSASCGEDRKQGDYEASSSTKAQTSGAVGEVGTDADQASGATPTTGTPQPAALDDTDSCHAGQTSAGERRGSGALSGGGNVSSTVITVTEPSPCHSPEHNVPQSREEDVKEWVNTSCSAAVAPAKGSMVIPIYVYDCHYHSITESLINRWTFTLPPDIHEDMTFGTEGVGNQPTPSTRGRLASFDKEASVVEEKEEPELARVNWRSSLDRKSTDGMIEGIGEFRRQCHLITESISHCFVTGLYQSLRHNYFVDQRDMDAAVNSICNESLPLEVDMTSFMLASCGHLQKLVTQARRDLMATLEGDIGRKHSVRFMEVVDIQSDDGEDIIVPEILQLPRKMVSMLPSLWADTVCEHVPGLHRQVEEKFTDIVQRFFRPVASMPDYFFYSPEAQQRTSVCEDYDQTEMKGDSTDEKTDDNAPDTDLSVRDEEEGENAPGELTPRGQAENRDRGNNSAHVSVDSNLEDSLSDIDLNITQDADEEVVPLFVHFTCTLKRRTEHYNNSFTKIPQCLGDLLISMKEPLLAINFGEFQITFDINCLTLPPNPDIDCLSPRNTNFLRSLSNQSQSSGGRHSDAEGDPDETQSTAASSDYAFEDPLCHLPLMQREAVMNFGAEITWLLRDEVTAALRYMHPINTDALEFVIAHVKESHRNMFPACRMERVNLQFVYGPDRSVKPFVEEFERMSQPGYHISKVDDFYILTVDRAHVNNLRHAQALQTALVVLSHEGTDSSKPSGVDGSKLFPAMEERSHSLPSILPSASPSTAGVAMPTAEGQQSSGSGGGGTSGDENRPHASLGAKFSKESGMEEAGLKQVGLRSLFAKKDGETELSDALLRKSHSFAGLQGQVTSAPATTTASPEVQSGSLSAIKASPSSVFGIRSRHFSAPSGQGTPQSRASTLPQTPSMGSSQGSAGFDGDVSDENMDDSASLSDTGPGHPLLPNFWLIFTISQSCVELFFHSRETEQDTKAHNEERELVSRILQNIEQICCKINKQLLLNELMETRMCNRLLVPEADEDVHWTDRRTISACEGDDEDESEEGQNRGYLAASLKFEPGFFACDCVWWRTFSLHPRLKTGTQRQGMTRGLLSLRSNLIKFSVNNRKNMFVIRETSSNNVFYIKLKELSSTSQNEAFDGQVDLESSMSEVSLSSLAQKTADPRLEPDTRSEGDTTSLASGYSRLSSRIEDAVELTVHGIVEPTSEIKEDLMKLLQNKLDDTVLEVISVMLARNPQCKLRPEDVQFLQCPEENATESLLLTIPSHAMMYLSALIYYLRQNLLLFLHTPCFQYDSPEYHFKDFVEDQWQAIPNDQVFLFISPQAGGRKGMATVSCGLVDGRSNPVHLLGCPCPSRLSSGTLPSIEDLKQMVKTAVHQPASGAWGPGPTALIQFRIWQRGYVDMRQLKERLINAVSHALCDIIMEFTMLAAPVCVTPRSLQDLKVVPVTSLPNSPVTVKKEPERKPTLGRKLSDSIRLKPLPQSASPFQSLRDAFSGRSRVASPPSESSRSFDWPQAQPSALALNSEQSRSAILSSGSQTNMETQELLELVAQYDRGDKGSLHTAFASLMEPWLAFCHEKRLAAVSKVEMPVRSGHTVEYMLKELQNMLPSVGVKAPVKMFKVLQYATMDSTPISVPFSPCNQPRPSVQVDNQIETAMDSVQAEVGSVAYVAVIRDYHLWNITTVPSDNAEYQTPTVPSHSDLKAHQNSMKFPPRTCDKVWDRDAVSGANQTFIPRQKLMVMFVINKKLLVYMYNFASDLTASVEKAVTRIVYWHNARACVLNSILHQKLGLFHHCTFEKPHIPALVSGMSLVMAFPPDQLEANPYMQSDGDIDNLIRFSAPPREVTRRHSSMTQQSRNISHVLNRYRPFDDTYRNLKPAKPMHKTVQGSMRDHVARHGTQAQEMRSRYRKDAEKVMKLQQIYVNWLQKNTPNPNPPVSEEYLELLKQSSRLFHYCSTPFLFCQQWRHCVLNQSSAAKPAPVPPPPTPEKEVVTSKSPAFPSLLTVPSHSTDRSRHSSGASLSSQRARRSDSQDAGRGRRTADPSPAPSLSKTPSAAEPLSAAAGHRAPGPGPSDAWHREMCLSFLTQYRNYLMSEFGFVCINVQPNVNRKGAHVPRTEELSQRHMTVNLQKTLTSGIILMELSLRSKYFFLRMFVLDYLQLGIRNHDMQMLFVDECEKYKDLIHVHSFAHDFHLRCINDYLHGTATILHSNFHISNFLSEFLQIHPVPPSYARNCFAQESALIRNLPCPGPQLFDYMRTQSRQFGTSVFRMTPSDILETDYCFIKQDDYALVQIREADRPVTEGEEGMVAEVELDGYNVTLIITQDTARSLTSSDGDGSQSMKLKFFVVLTRLRDIHPKRTLEKKFGDFRVGVASQLSQPEGSDGGSLGSGEGELSVPIAVKQHLGVRQEHTNYLGYSNVHQTRIYNLLTAQINAGREKIEEMVQMSKVKCRRDYLWQRMSAVKEEGKKKGKQMEEAMEPNMVPLNAAEFEELLQLVCQQPLNEVDPRLAILSNMPTSWYSGLLPVLTSRFSNTYRCFSSQQATLNHTVVLNAHWQDMFILLSVDSMTGCMGLSQVLRNPCGGEEEERRLGEQRGEAREDPDVITEQKHRLIEDFVNVCCFHLWASIL